MATGANTRQWASEAEGRWILFATILASSMAFIGQSTLNLVLPSIQEDLDASGAEVLWVTNAFALLLASMILVGGSLGDHFGRKRIFMIGIVLFTTAAILCGIAPTVEFLIAARLLEGVGGALMIPGSLAIISASFSPQTRGRAIGTWSSFSTFTTILGPIIGGFLADAGFWRAVFFINVPLAVMALAALYYKVPESKDEGAPAQLDYPGAVLVALGLAGLTFGFIETPRLGLTHPAILVAFIGGVAALIAFVFVERNSDHPMLPLRLFKSRTFSGTNIMTLFLYAGLGGLLFFLPLNFIQIQGYRESEAAVALLPFGLLLTLMSRWAGGLVDKYGPRLPLTIGPTIVAIGFFILSLPGLTDGFNDYFTTFLPGLFIAGVGMGVTVAPLTTAVMGSVSSQQAGTASGVNNAVARTAGVLAVAVMGGIALASFVTALNTRTEDVDLTAEQREELEEGAADFGATEVPTDVPAESVGAVEEAIQLAFVDTFRVLAYIGAGLALLSAALAYLTVDKRLEAID